LSGYTEKRLRNLPIVYKGYLFGNVAAAFVYNDDDDDADDDNDDYVEGM